MWTAEQQRFVEMWTRYPHSPRYRVRVLEVGLQQDGNELGQFAPGLSRQMAVKMLAGEGTSFPDGKSGYRQEELRADHVRELVDGKKPDQFWRRYWRTYAVLPLGVARPTESGVYRLVGEVRLLQYQSGIRVGFVIFRHLETGEFRAEPEESSRACFPHKYQLERLAPWCVAVWQEAYLRTKDVTACREKPGLGYLTPSANAKWYHRLYPTPRRLDGKCWGAGKRTDFQAPPGAVGSIGPNGRGEHLDSELRAKQLLLAMGRIADPWREAKRRELTDVTPSAR